MRLWFLCASAVGGLLSETGKGLIDFLFNKVETLWLAVLGLICCGEIRIVCYCLPGHCWLQLPGCTATS